jgi:hypothetical protein
MINGFEIIQQIQEKFPKICYKLAGITGKTYEWFSSHGREAKTHNPLASGNLSPVDHILTYARQYEAADRGAGLMLIHRIAAELQLEFEGCQNAKETKEILNSLLREFSDVAQELNNCDTSKWHKSDYAYAETQCDELSEIALTCKSKFRVLRKEAEAKV